MISTTQLIEKVSSGVMQIGVGLGGKLVECGSGFLTKDGIVTNCHIAMSKQRHDTLAIRFADRAEEEQLLIETGKLFDVLGTHSEREQFNFAVLKVNDPRLEGRFRFELSKEDHPLKIGEKVLFFGFPYGLGHLTAHRGAVSGLTPIGKVDAIQIDGSMNGGNTGGPVLDLKTGRVAGILTDMYRGPAPEFMEAQRSLEEKREMIGKMAEGGEIGDARVTNALRAVMAGIGEISKDLKRAATIGVGWANSSRHLREALNAEKARDAEKSRDAGESAIKPAETVSDGSGVAMPRQQQE